MSIVWPMVYRPLNEYCMVHGLPSYRIVCVVWCSINACRVVPVHLTFCPHGLCPLVHRPVGHIQPSATAATAPSSQTPITLAGGGRGGVGVNLRTPWDSLVYITSAHPASTTGPVGQHHRTCRPTPQDLSANTSGPVGQHLRTCRPAPQDLSAGDTPW